MSKAIFEHELSRIHALLSWPLKEILKRNHKVGLSQFLLDAPLPSLMLTSQGTLEEWVGSSSYSYLDENPKHKVIKTKSLSTWTLHTHNLETREILIYILKCQVEKRYITMCHNNFKPPQFSILPREYDITSL
jgi:hypothetical protein